MTLSEQDRIRLEAYSNAMVDLSDNLNHQLKGCVTFVEYFTKFLDIFEYYYTSTDKNFQFISYIMMVIEYPSLAMFFLYDNDQIENSRTVFINLLTFILRIADKQHCVFNKSVLKEIDRIIQTFDLDTAKNGVCLDSEAVDKIVLHWNIINDPIDYCRYYIQRWKDTRNGVSYNELYGVFVAIYLWLSKQRSPNDQIFIDKSTEYIVWLLCHKLERSQFTIHPLFLKGIKQILKKLSKYAD